MKTLLISLALAWGAMGVAHAQLDRVLAVTEKWKVVVNGVTNSGSATGIVSVRLGSFKLIDKVGFPHAGGIRQGYLNLDGTLDSHSLVYGNADTVLGQFALLDLNFTTIAVNLGEESGTSFSTNRFLSRGAAPALTGAGRAVIELPRRSISISITTTSTVTPYVDTRKPVVAITSPKSRQRTTNSVFVITGKATDEIAVTNVQFKLNYGDWAPATTTDNWLHWSTPALPLIPRTNVLSAWAADSSGNRSATNTVKFYYVLNSQPSVQVVGPGVVAPNYNGKNLEVGRNFSMTARPRKGCRFVDWTGDLVSTNRRLNFTMTFAPAFVATFADVARPVNAITSPKTGRLITNDVFTAAGKAGDNVGVDSVWLQLNDAGWVSAVSSNAFKAWSASGLIPVTGTNLLESFAVDAAGNISLTNRLRFRH